MPLIAHVSSEIEPEGRAQIEIMAGRVNALGHSCASHSKASAAVRVDTRTHSPYLSMMSCWGPQGSGWVGFSSVEERTGRSRSSATGSDSGWSWPPRCRVGSVWSSRRGREALTVKLPSNFSIPTFSATGHRFAGYSTQWTSALAACED